MTYPMTWRLECRHLVHPGDDEPMITSVSVESDETLPEVLHAIETQLIPAMLIAMGFHTDTVSRECEGYK